MRFCDIQTGMCLPKRGAVVRNRVFGESESLIVYEETYVVAL